MKLRKTLLSGIFSASLALSGGAAIAQDATPETVSPEATPVAEITTLEQVPIHDAQGNVVAHADIWEEEDDDEGGVWFSITGVGDASLSEGKYGVHVHEYGVCDPEADPAFSSAGGHFNPTNEEHGDINADPSHAGDLGNLEVDEEGNFEHEVLAEKVTMRAGEPASLADTDGTALIIHSGEDDLETDPDGNAGDPWACAVIFPPLDEEATPEASPVETEATPVS